MYFTNTVQNNIYDDKRQALYLIVANQVPDQSQNVQIFLSISRDNAMTWSQPIASMRGIVLLTAALALPLTLDNGQVLEARSEVIYMVFCVILFTLIIPGLSLGKVISWLNLPTAPLDETSNQTRKNLATVALEEIKRLHASNSVSDEEHSLLVDYFNSRVRLWERIAPENNKHTHLETARKKVVQAQRAILVDIWEKGQINDKVRAQIEHELDVEETQTARAEI